MPRQDNGKGNGQGRVVSLAQQLERRLAEQRQTLADVDRQIADLVARMGKGNGGALVERFLPLKGRRDLLQASVESLADQLEGVYLPDLRARVAAAQQEKATYAHEVRDPADRRYQALGEQMRKMRAALHRSGLTRAQRRQEELAIPRAQIELLQAKYALEDANERAHELSRAHQKLRDELAQALALLQEARDPAPAGAPVQGALLAPV